MRQVSLAAWSRTPARTEGFARRIPPPPADSFRITEYPDGTGLWKGTTIQELSDIALPYGVSGRRFRLRLTRTGFIQVSPNRSWAGKECACPEWHRTPPWGKLTKEESL